MDVDQNRFDKKSEEKLCHLNCKNGYHDSQGSAHSCAHDCDLLQQKDIKHNPQSEKAHEANPGRPGASFQGSSPVAPNSMCLVLPAVG